MKSKITLFVIALLLSGFCFAQSPGAPSVSEGPPFNPDKKACLTPEQRSDMIQDIQGNIEELRLQNRLSFSEQRRGNHPLFIWPVQKANDVTFNEIYSIYNYMDHDPDFNDDENVTLLDYDCGTRTYDTNAGYNHEGTDIVTWPFPWKMLDDDGVEIIAAAPGQIILKIDGEFDRSCTFNNPDPWNIIVVQHSDGSVAAYGHMKNGSVTTKNIGDMVSTGEYLGIVGSSGISTIPHLHFEVLTDETFTQIVDPYSGPCNATTVDSWWQSQRPYTNPGINAVLTHSAAPVVFPPCGTSETPNLSNEFDAGDPISFTVFNKDQTAGDNIFLEILRPDNSTLFANWNITVQTTAPSWYYLWDLNGYFDMVGEWKWRVTFGGETVTHTFNVGDPLSVKEEDFSQTSVYPNPFNDVLNINSNTKIISAIVVDVLGKTVLKFEKSSVDGIKKLNLAQLSNGMYFITLEGELNQKKTIKLIKK